MECANCGHNQNEHAYYDAQEMDDNGNIAGPTHCHGAGLDLANSEIRCAPTCKCPDFREKP